MATTTRKTGKGANGTIEPISVRIPTAIAMTGLSRSRIYELIACAVIPSAILAAPGWARVGITMPNDRLREQAAEELARAIVDRLHHAEPGIDADQLALPI